MSDNNYLGMSDEDFAQINAPGEPPEDTGQGETPGQTGSEAVPQTPGTEQAAELNAAAQAAAGGDTGQQQTAGEGGGEGENNNQNPQDSGSADTGKTDGTVQPDANTAAGGPTDQSAAAEGDPPSAGSSGSGTEVEETPLNAEDFLKEVMKPFKANGKTIELKSPQEALRLMQMGAGYGRKIQDLQPYLKTIKMLENNGLLDESRLSYLIDLDKKNPDAIKKLIQESGLDPLDINTVDPVDYQPNNHAVSDQEMAFHEVVSEITSHDTGQETLQIVNQTWDSESKAFLWKEPGVLKVIQSQRESGLYDHITAEIERQKLLGEIPHNTPFLKAYKMAGDALVAAHSGKTGQIPQTPLTASSGGIQEQPQPQVIATRPAQPKPQATNTDRAKAAAAPQSSPSRAAPFVNPLEMADDEFLKKFKDRL